MLYEGLIRERGATISTQVGASDVMNQDRPTSSKHISCFVLGGSPRG